MVTCQVKDRVLGSTTWEYVPNGSCLKDDFPGVAGRRGQPDVKRPKVQVIKDFKYTGARGDLLKGWLRLFPGNIDRHREEIDKEVKRTNPKAATVTTGELVVWEGLFLAATLVPQKGHELFIAPAQSRRFTPFPGFDEYMTLKRFEAIKAAILAPCAYPDSAGEDPWWEIRRLVDDFNANRLSSVLKSQILIPDEAMSPYQPRTTSSGDLAHLSFVERKPKKLGTEFKCVADGVHGAMLFLEIQEGKDAMARKRFRDGNAPATAQALRLANGVNGK